MAVQREKVTQMVSFNEDDIVADGFEAGNYEPRYRLLSDRGNRHSPDVDGEIDQGTRSCRLAKSLAF
jgi:hypothetical protein